MSSRHRRNKLPPFVPLYKETMKTSAWIAMSNGARMLYVVLKWNYNTRLQNHVFISTRDAEKKLGSTRKSIMRWFRELEHYGFTVMLSPGGLGVEGKGKAPHWRITEECYLGQAPTRDFLLWDGKRFYKERTAPKCSKIRVPGTLKRPTAVRISVPLATRKREKNRRSGTHKDAIYATPGGTHKDAITSLATPCKNREAE